MQVVNGVLLPINLFFIWRLGAQPRAHGQHRNHGLVDALSGATVLFASTLSAILVAVTVLGF